MFKKQPLYKNPSQDKGHGHPVKEYQSEKEVIKIRNTANRV
jgi:hypothetical protein